jgi:4-amino-4-deoxychorismate lyase
MRTHGGEIQNLRYHQQRFERTRETMFGKSDHPLLSDLIPVPEEYRQGTFRCRLLYGPEMEELEFLPHNPLNVSSLRIVHSEEIGYAHKSADRRALKTLFETRGKCDDILIIKKGRLTDSYLANVVLLKGRTWYTPDSPLLPGTMRAALLDEGKIKEWPIMESDIRSFRKIRLINALNPLETSPDIDIRQIYT